MAQANRPTSTSPTGLRVLVTLGPEVLRKGIEALLGELHAITGVRVASTVGEAMVLLRRQRPDLLIVIVEDDVPVDRLVTAARRAGVPTLAVLSRAGDALRDRTVPLAADGFILAGELDRRSLNDALTELWRGEMPMPLALGRVALSALREDHRPADTPALTPREGETLRLLARGLSNRQIAGTMGITEHGAKRHVCHILAKLNCTNRTEAVTAAYQLGLLPARR
ncbi:response regulator transcription factor [Micromonospora sp. WMMD975]|uniref:LuxR C-terminal-related transcriptional regulator n=1 Tax=Micromonospora sp. WMMD975 TaxID=3016087 RepID=UPI00249B7E9C|nr:response regulator transcription factor [Micromonospora sp. WMMD975]WFE32722.1 response regulator transcription factor [Micromonospora sp. WMMD975]